MKRGRSKIINMLRRLLNNNLKVQLIILDGRYVCLVASKIFFFSFVTILLLSSYLLFLLFFFLIDISVNVKTPHFIY